MQSLNIFMQGLLDYAGLFPPATLSLQDALKNFAEYHHHDQKKWLGKFILPANKIDETISLLNNLNTFSTLNQKAPFSIILNSCDKLTDYPNYLEKDLIIINNFRKKFETTIDILSFEFLPPKEIFEPKNHTLLNDFISIFNNKIDYYKHKLEFYCELPLNPFLNEYIKSIIQCNNKQNSYKLSIKLRTGGVTPQQIPKSIEIAQAILLCAQEKISLKATAGLHVPVPNDNSDVGARLHGFLNIFSSLLLCYDHLLSIEEIDEIISHCSYEDFKFTDEGLFVRNKFISNEKMQQFRNLYIKSFGTCSFLEPIEHLQHHQFIL
ncbi:hypothetical protein [Silvanigrella aquatica]|uniref:Uncharacterized protein n=1 Tax=Silvanigrella aquatica TaxID=1915309 RepID=A0A1L4D3E9_9BACT|nr:hypothetical protein [Silvanigrella aquatica]APJ04736.1 hypothetical protein AXG55_12850 [Silvanigrella aquatica]